MSKSQNQELGIEPELASQYEHITKVVNLLRGQVESLSSLAYDILTDKPETIEEWDVFIHRYNLIEATNKSGVEQ